MRTLKLLSVLLVCLALSVCAAAADEISGETLQQIIDNSMFINLFDVRTESEYATGAIPGAECVPLDRLEAAMQQILDGGFNNMSVDVYLYGATAEDSAAAAGIMSKLGFTNAHYLPGISAWPGALQDTGLLLGNLDTVDIYGSRVDSTLIADKKLTAVEVVNKHGETRTLEVNGLFVAVGRIPENQNFAQLIALDSAGYALSGEDCHTDTPGIFVAGDNRVKEVRQLVTATADGAVAATEAIKYLNQ